MKNIIVSEDVYPLVYNHVFSQIDIDTEEDFLAWVQSPDFAEGHRSAMEAANEHPEPLPLTAELWSYTVELQADGSTD